MSDEDSLKMDNKDEFECQIDIVNGTRVTINYINYCNDICPYPWQKLYHHAI